MPSSRVLVTGAAGFLGSHLCDALLAGGTQVVGFDNLSTGSLKNLDHLRREPRFSFHEVDIIDFHDPGPVDYVFNFASPARPSDYTRLGIQTLLAGSAGTLNTLEIAQRYNAGYLHASAGDCYGDPTVQSPVQSPRGNVSPIGPSAVYDEAKRYAETLVCAFRRYHRLDTHIVRIFDVYGPRLHSSDDGPIPHLLRRALRGESLTISGDGSQTISSCYVSDIMAGILRLAFSSEHQPVDMGNPTETTLLDCAREIQAVVGSHCQIMHVPGTHDERRYLRPDITRARVRLAWQPKVELRQGLKLSLGYFSGCAQSENVVSFPHAPAGSSVACN